jgi:hypothetical protein
MTQTKKRTRVSSGMLVIGITQPMIDIEGGVGLQNADAAGPSGCVRRTMMTPEGHDDEGEQCPDVRKMREYPMA